MNLALGCQSNCLEKGRCPFCITRSKISARGQISYFKGRSLSWIGFGFPSSLPFKKPTTFKLLQNRTEKLYCTFTSRLKSFVVVNDESLYS